MNATIKTSDLKKALSVLKKINGGALNYDRAVSVTTRFGKLVINYTNGNEDVTWHPGIEASKPDPEDGMYHARTWWTTIKALESALNGKTVTLEDDGDKLRANGLPVEMHAPLEFPEGWEALQVPAGTGLSLGPAGQRAYLDCLPAASTKKIEEATPHGRPQLAHIVWDEDGFTGTNGKVLLHISAGNLPYSDRPDYPKAVYIPTDPIVVSIIKAELGLGDIGIDIQRKEAEKGELRDTILFAMYGEKFSYVTRWKAFNYPVYRHVMTRGNGPDLQFNDLVTPLLPNVTYKDNTDGPGIALDWDDHKPCLVTKNADRIPLDAEFGSSFNGAGLRQDFLKLAFENGITKLRYVNGQYWGENAARYITFMQFTYKTLKQKAEEEAEIAAEQAAAAEMAETPSEPVPAT